MTPLQLLCLVSCISQDMRYGAQLHNLIEYLCHILKLKASWSELSYANVSIMHILLSPTSSLITGNLGKMTVLVPFRYLVPGSQSQCPRNRKWKKNCILNLQLINWQFMLTCSHFKSCNRHVVELGWWNHTYVGRGNCDTVQVTPTYCLFNHPAWKWARRCC